MKKRLASMLCAMVLVFAALVPAAFGETLPVYKDSDLDATWDAASATHIQLAGTEALITGEGAYVEGDALVITRRGTYVLTGAWENGMIVIAAGDNDKVQLVLAGVSITNQRGPAIHAKSADKLTITLEGGSENSLCDGETYADLDESLEPDATLYSTCDLVINGEGSLSVIGKYKNGVLTKDDLIIAGGTIAITAANVALRGRDSVSILGGSFTLESGGDALQSNNDTASDKGWIAISGGSFAIASGKDGIQAETTLSISGGEFTIVSGGGAGTLAMENRGGDDWGFRRNTAQTAETEETVSQKGLKSRGAVYLSGGSFTMDCADDAIHSNGDIQITGGTYSLATGDDGVHADGSLAITAGTITVTGSYEGLEAARIVIDGGVIDVTAQDDGINVAGGTDGSGGRDWFGSGGFASIDADYAIVINGGEIVINSTADGIDSNGHITINGGTVIVHGPTSGGDGPIDCEGTFTYTGGTIVAAGSSGMSQYPGQASVAGIMAYFGTAVQGGSQVTLLDTNGNIVYAHTPTKAFECLLLCIPGLAEGESYTLYVNGEETGALTLGSGITTLGSGGGFGFGGRGGRQNGTPAMSAGGDEGNMEKPEQRPGDRGGW